jgi:hypothetical protein
VARKECPLRPELVQAARHAEARVRTDIALEHLAIMPYGLDRLQRQKAGPAPRGPEQLSWLAESILPDAGIHAFLTGGITQLPSRIEGSPSLGQ